MNKFIKVVIYLCGGFAVLNLMVVFPAFMSGAPADWIGWRVVCVLFFGGLSYCLAKVLNKKRTKSEKPIMVVYGNSKQESSTNGKSDNHCNSKPETFSISEKNIQLELGIRMKTRLAFDDIVSDTISRRKNDPLIDGLMVKSAIANFYESMRKDKTMESMLKERGINYQKILEEECSKTIEKYFNGDCINYNTVK